MLSGGGPANERTDGRGGGGRPVGGGLFPSSKPKTAPSAATSPLVTAQSMGHHKSTSVREISWAGDGGQIIAQERLPAATWKDISCESLSQAAAAAAAYAAAMIRRSTFRP